MLIIKYFSITISIFYNTEQRRNYNVADNAVRRARLEGNPFRETFLTLCQEFKINNY